MSPDFRVVAIVAAYNEADIIEQVVRDLIQQDIEVYVLDDGSTDRTVAIVEPYVGKGVLRIERLAPASSDAPAGRFEWERILRRKAEVAMEIDANWFMHHDADEFRESPWPERSLHGAIRRVDALGYNAIDFTSLDFWPVHDRFRAGDSVRDAFTWHAPQAPYDRVQIRCWKKTAHPVDLASSGGHEARFPDRAVFPLRFILRHYPVRGQAHGERKVFAERRERFLPEERARGWHVQYDHLRDGASFIRDPSTLTPYDGDAVRLALTLRHRGVEALEASLEEAQATVATLRGDLNARVQELEDRAASLARTRAELGAALHVERAEAAVLRNAIDERALVIEKLQATIAEHTRRVDELHRSLSWRYTAPARALYRMLRGRD